MADAFRDLARGEKLHKITAPQIQGWNAAARAERARKYDSDYGVGDDPTSPVYIRVQNDSGGTRARFSVMRIASPLINYDENSVEFKSNPSAHVDLPGATTDLDVIAILNEPLEDQKFGRAIIAGIAPVQINVAGGTEAGWKWADVVSGNADHMTMAEKCGPARVLWKQSGTGVKWALVYLLGPACTATGLCGWESAPGFDPLADGLVMTVDPTTGCVILVPSAPCGTPTVINSFGIVSVSGQSDVVADTPSDTLTLVAGTGMALTTDAGADSVTFATPALVVPTSATDGAVVLFDGTTGKLGKDSVITMIDNVAFPGNWTMTLNAGASQPAGTGSYIFLPGASGIRTGHTSGDSFNLQIWNTGTSSFNTVMTASVGSSPNLDLSGTRATIGGNYIYRKFGDAVALVDGGLGTHLTAPGSDNIFFYDVSAASSAFLTLGTGLSITGTTLDATVPNTFQTISVSGQSDVVADSATDTLTLVAGANVTLTTNASTDTITITASGGGGASNSFTTISISGQSDVVADSSTDTLTFVAGDGISLTTNASTDTITITDVRNVFAQVAVSGQSTVVADGTADTLTLVAGSNVTITTDASTDSITITASGGGGASDSFTTIAVASQSSVIADSSTDTLTLVAGSNIAITTNASTDTITFAASQNTFTIIAVSGQSNVVADIEGDTLTLVAGTNIAITTNAGTDSVTIANTANTFTTISVSGQSDVVADTPGDVLTLVSGSGIAITTDASTDTITVTNNRNTFSTISVAGQSNVDADVSTDTLTLVAGSNITITTDASTDSITITASGGGGASDSFTTIAVSGQSSVIADSSTDTLTLVGTGNMTITTNASTDTITFNAANQNTFTTIAVSGQSNVVADAAADALTLVAGSGMTITTDASTDTITFVSSGGGGNSFTTIAIAGQSSVVADSSTDTLTLVAGDGIALTTNASTDTITVSNIANVFTNIAVSGQSTVVADGTTDTLTLVAGSGIVLTTNATTDTITITNTATPLNTFSTIAVSGQSNVDADSTADTLTLVAGTNVTITTVAGADSITINSSQFTFKTIRVSTQSDVVADSDADILTLATGRGIQILTDAATDTITFVHTLYAFDGLAVAGQASVIPDGSGTLLTLANGTNIAITTNAGTDTVTIGITGIIQSNNGGTGNGFFKVAGPTTAEKTFTIPDASANIITDNAGSLTPLHTLLAQIPGYNATVSQSLTHDAAGALKWVDDGTC